MKLNRGMLTFFAGFSLFLGFIIFGVALGGVFPSLYKYPASLICRGEVKVKTITQTYVPGETTSQHTVYCSTAETQKDITFLAFVATGLLSSLVIFVLLAIWKRNLLFSSREPGAPARERIEAKSAAPEGKGTPLERIASLKKMKDANLISDMEYEQKKAEILKEV